MVARNFRASSFGLEGAICVSSPPPCFYWEYRGRSPPIFDAFFRAVIP